MVLRHGGDTHHKNALNCSAHGQTKKKLEQLFEVSALCIDDHQFKEEEPGNGGRVVKCWLSDCPAMPVFGAYRQI